MESIVARLEAEPSAIETLDVERIRTDGGTQGRERVDMLIIKEYAELMRGGVSFPPVRIWFDGSHHWLVDGFQRLEATKLNGVARIAAEVLHGSLEEAKWDSYGANCSHGIRRTEGDMQLVLKRALNHPNATQMSNNEIARHLHLPEATFRRWKKHLSSSRDEDTTRLVNRAGILYEMQIARIGKGHEAHRVRPKSRRQLQHDLEEMRDLASPDARRVLSILGNWIRDNSTALPTLAAFEVLILDLRSSRAKLG
jgi:hypothetical protein